MSSDSMVVEDGVDESQRGTRARSGWVLAAVGFGLGLALGTIIASPSDAPTPTDVASEPTFADGPTEPKADEDDGISAIVPGFPDALVAIEDDSGGGFGHLLWPVAGPLVTRSMTGGSDIRFDATNQHLAMSEEVPGLDGLLLSMGRFNSMRPVVTEVTSYAWHDSQPGQLAYTAFHDGEWQLVTVSVNLRSEVVASGILEDGSVVAWGDWGFAIQAPGDQVVLLTEVGEFKDQQEGIGLASHEDGWILIDNGGLELLSAGGGVRGLEAGEVGSRIQAAAFSPDGTKAAMTGRFGVMVVDLAEAEAIRLEPPYPADWVSWSSDSRFVIAPAQSGVLIHDLEADEPHRVLVGHTVVVATVVPLSSS